MRVPLDGCEKCLFKGTFLNELKNQIAEYPSEETNQSVEYYSEMIDDQMEDGMSEAEAVASMGKVAVLALGNTIEVDGKSGSIMVS